MLNGNPLTPRIVAIAFPGIKFTWTVFSPTPSKKKQKKQPLAKDVKCLILSPRSASGSKKKKSWVSNALNPTYRSVLFFHHPSISNYWSWVLIRSRCDDLRRNFPGLPPTETLIVDYSCALQKDILVLHIAALKMIFFASAIKIRSTAASM